MTPNLGKQIFICSNEEGDQDINSPECNVSKAIWWPFENQEWYWLIWCLHTEGSFLSAACLYEGPLSTEIWVQCRVAIWWPNRKIQEQDDWFRADCLIFVESCTIHKPRGSNRGAFFCAAAKACFQDLDVSFYFSENIFLYDNPAVIQ